MGKRYPTELSGAEEPYLPAPGAVGGPWRHSLREILDAILLPHEFPPWKTIHHCFRVWRLDGTWERLDRALRRVPLADPR